MGNSCTCTKLNAPGPSVVPAAKEYPRAAGQVVAVSPPSKSTWDWTRLDKKQEQTLFKDLRNRQDNGNIAKDSSLKKIYGTE